MRDHQASAAEQEMESLLAQAHAPGLTHRYDQLKVGSRYFTTNEVIHRLEGLLTPDRKARIAQVIAKRSFQVAPVVEGLINTGNVSAVMRTSEGLGFQPFHVINNGNTFKHSERVSHGAEKWLSLWRWPEPSSCARFLKHQGYRVIATTLDQAAVPLTSLDFSMPTALVWGNEAQGITSDLLAEADQLCYIPMSGFTESLNISVAAAVSLFFAYEQLSNMERDQVCLSPGQATYLKALFYYRSVKHSDRLLLKQD